MSGAPKRGPHEEGGHSSASSVRPEEEAHALPRVNFGLGQDTRPGLLPLPDSRDGERRVVSPYPLYRMPSVMADHASQPVTGPEVRPEVRESKDAREHKGAESSRDVKVEPREAHNQSGKVEKEGRVESRKDDSKEVKNDREKGNVPRLEAKWRFLPEEHTREVHNQSGKVEKEGRVESRKDDSKEVKIDREKGNVPRLEAKWRFLPEEQTREAHTQSGKVEKEGRVESRKDDSKEVKNDREKGSAPRLEAKWRFLPEEQTRAARDGSGGVGGAGILGTRNASPLHTKIEVAKEAAMSTSVKDSVEGSEDVGESRVDTKADDKSKDRKPKDGMHYDWSEGDKDRSDHRSNLQAGSSSNNDMKEATKEDKESERLEREKRDAQKERERIKERDKDHTDREGRSGGEREGYRNEKDVADKPSVQENLALESKKPTDSWRNLEREAKERRKERDGDVEGERPEKRRCIEKESEEGAADVDGATDKERDAFGYTVQQKKRMLRPRGSPQVTNRDARFKCRGLDAEGSQGKPELSAVYKVGECLQELTKLWVEYISSQGEKASENLYNGPTLEIRIPAEHVTATNRQVRGGQLWGTDIYTNDSDLVAVLMHTGYCRPTASPPPAAIQELRATIRVLPAQESYVSSLRNNVRSRAWGAAIGCSYRVESCCILKKVGGTIDLEPCLTHTSAIEPTLAPVAVERTMTTRAAASNALRQQRFVREVTIQYNLCNEPWIKYSISVVADKGLKKPLFTSARLKKGEVLYLETHACRYELCYTGEKIVKSPSMTQIHEAEAEKSQNHASSANGDRIMTDADNSHSMVVDMFRWSRCKKPLIQKVMRSIGIPLPLDHVEVLEENLDWEDVQWSQTGVWIVGKEYPLARVHFLSQN